MNNHNKFKVKIKLNSTNLPSVYTDLCSKQVLGNVNAFRMSRCRSVVNSASCEVVVAASADCSLLQLIEGHVVGLATRGSQEGVNDI